MTKGITLKLIPSLLLMAFAGAAGASGFALQNQTGSGNGTAFAGAAAAAEDAGTVFFNPAGMTYLNQGHNISVAGTVLNRSIKFSNNGSVSNSGAAPLVTNADGGDAGGVSLIPAAYWAYSVTPNLWLGLGISPTFGNKTEYDFNFVGRNSGFFAEMKQININPSIAYKATDKLSLGFGLNFAHNETRFKQGFPLAALSPDNFADIKGEAWAVGYNLGAMYQLSPSTRLGVSYRSKLEFDLTGKYHPEVNVAAAGFTDQDIRAVLKTPDTLSFAVSQKLSDKWEMLGDVSWTGWKLLNTLDLKTEGGSTLASLSYNFKDTYRVGLGANYQHNDQWKFRFGVAYDQSPVRAAPDRTMTLPDSDRIWLSFGAKYQLTKVSSIDVGYTHIFFKDASTERQVTTSGTLRQTINGNWNNNSADLLSLQYNHTF